MEPRAPKLEMILEYVGPGKGDDAYQLWGCRGAGKGCKRRVKKTKRHCADCLHADDMSETIGDFKNRLDRGNA